MPENKKLDIPARIILVDFDGTCVKHEYPKVGEDVPNAVRVLRRCVNNGDKLILWTMRADSEKSGLVLSDAVAWFARHRLLLWGVNENPNQASWTLSPKVYAHIYIDDAALGCPLKPGTSPGDRPFVAWDAVEKLLFNSPVNEYITLAYGMDRPK